MNRIRAFKKHVMSRHRFFMLAWRQSWISVHCITLKYFIFIFFEFLIPTNLCVDIRINLLGAFLKSYEQT